MENNNEAVNKEQPVVNEANGTIPLKADLGKRFVAFLIDSLLSFVVGFVPIIGGVAAAVYMLLRDGLDIEFMNKRSLGKKIMKLRPVTLSGAPMDITASAKRNWMFALGGVAQFLVFIPILGWILIPFVVLAAIGLCITEVVLVVTNAEGIRLGDKMAQTKVIEVAE